MGQGSQNCLNHNSNTEVFRQRFNSLLKYMYRNDAATLQLFEKEPEKIQNLSEIFYQRGSVEEIVGELAHLRYQTNSKSKKLICATLNFSGININPFEYHDGSQQLKDISSIMGLIIAKEGHKFTEPELSIIDKKYKKSDISVRLGYGMKTNGKLPNKSQYIKMWIQQYQRTKPPIKGDTEHVVNSMALFQYYCFLAITCYVYKTNYDPETFEINEIKMLDPDILIDFLKNYFKRPSSNIDLKEKKVLNYIYENNIDVMFIQEGGSINWAENLQHDYGFTRNADSVIIFRKYAIGNERKDLHEKYKDQLNFNEDTAFYFSENKYLLLSVHLTSKKHKVQQGKKMLTILEKVRKENRLFKIIVGVDANQPLHFFEENKLNIAPNLQAETTATKKRTNVQVQFDKAEKEVKEIKDQILSNIKSTSSSVNVITGEKKMHGELLPNERHPYDHFVVVGEFDAF